MTVTKIVQMAQMRMSQGIICRQNIWQGRQSIWQVLTYCFLSVVNIFVQMFGRNVKIFGKKLTKCLIIIVTVVTYIKREVKLF